MEVDSEDVENVNMFEWLSLESIVHILEFLPRVDDAFLFGETCKYARSAVSNHLSMNFPSKYRPNFRAIQDAAKSKKCKPKKITGLYSEQIKGLMTLDKYPEDNLFLQSPMGTGKTLLALLHAIRSWKEHRIRTVIVATTKCFTSWWTHLTMCGLGVIKARPEKSDVLVLHSTCPAHRKFLMDTEIEAFKTLPYYLILTTSTYLRRGRYTLTKLRALNGIYTQTIADEAHLLNPTTYVDFFSTFERNTYLSATYFPGKVKYTPRGAHASIVKNMYTKKVELGCCVDHPVKMEYSLIPNAGSSSVRNQLIEMLSSEAFQTHQKVVLFTNWNPQRMRSHFEAMKSHFEAMEEESSSEDPMEKESSPQFTFLKFNNANTRALNLFREHGKRCVLVTTILSASEGTNFEVADAAIYMSFGEREIKRARQCFGRVRRRNNPNAIVHNYVLYNDSSNVQYVRTLLNVYYAVDLNLNIERKSAALIMATAAMCSKKGIDIRALPKPEFITLFSFNNKRDEFLPFKEEEYTLPLFQIMQLMNLGTE